MDKKTGKVYLVGAGPSDPELLTVKGLRLLKSADVVVYDNLIGDSIISMIPSSAKGINVGKRAGNHLVPQEKINEILRDEALDGKVVVRLKGGDPFLFGRGGEELELLIENNIPFEIVPGITSAISVPAYNGIPVTHRDFTSSLHIITGHKKNDEEKEIDYDSLVKLDGTLVFLMGLSSVEKISQGLLKAGMREDMPVAILEKGTRSKQRCILGNLSNIAIKKIEEKAQTPAIFIVGEVVKLHEKFEWNSKRSLSHLKIGVLRPENKASKLADKIREKGGEVILMPSIKTVELDLNEEENNLLKNLEKYSVIAFTSPTAVEIFMKKLLDIGLDSRNLWNIKLAVIGQSTGRKLREYGLNYDIIPKKYTGDELGLEILKNNIDKQVLIPRSKIGKKDILNILDSNNIAYKDLPIYTTEFQENKEVMGYKEDIDVMAFTSASTVESFVNNNENLDFSKINAVCIGEETAKEARKYNMNIFVSKKASIDDLILCIEENFKRVEK